MRDTQVPLPGAALRGLFSAALFRYPGLCVFVPGKKNSVGSRSWWGKADVSLFSFDPRLVVETLGAVGTS